MDNNASNKPQDKMSPWAQAEELQKQLDKIDLEKAIEKRRDLDFKILQYSSTEAGPNKEQIDLWNIVMPIPFDISVEIFNKSKYMSDEFVKNAVFPHYELNDTEQQLFQMLYAYGKACGIDDVMSRIYRDSCVGEYVDFKSQAKYLEIMLNQTGNNAQQPYIHIILDNSDFNEEELTQGNIYEGEGVVIKEGRQVIKSGNISNIVQLPIKEN